LFHLPTDLEHFKKNTLGKAIVIGRNTLLSFKNGKPLPGRHNIVLSRTMEAGETELKNGYKLVVRNTPDEVRSYLRENGLWDDAVLAGGEAIYRLFLDDCSELVVTEIDAEAPEVDTYFPEFKDKFELAKADGPYYDGKLSYSINTYRRKTMKQYIVDAFTPVPFAGNPAAVCVMDSWPSEEAMMKMAMENNLSETAFIVKEPQGYHLRWFTPTTEVELCGHATLASSYVILNIIEPESSEVRFNTLSGELIITRKGDLLEMNFPAGEQHEIPVTDAMEECFGARPVKALLGMDLICVFDSEDTVRNMNPPEQLLMKLDGRIQVPTARGKNTDIVSRVFAPKVGIYEDPVTGSSHTQLGSYWSEVLGKPVIEAYQASKRGGYLQCEPLGGGRIAIRGKAALVAVSEIKAELK
ncbi:MAG: PhzF family phenazine biosynthesis isomerase, partial [Firmicutes bacterium]|nr:PhzF family phenazine biosynthesis isomerase [Bacillota bacterium]